EMSNVAFFEVGKAAAIPAILYYVGLMAMVHFLAVRHGLQPRPRGELPSWGTIFRQAYLALPFVGIVYFLAAGYSPTGAAFYVIVITFVLSFLDRRKWMTPRRCLEALVVGDVSTAPCAVVTARSVE